MNYNNYILKSYFFKVLIHVLLLFISSGLFVVTIYEYHSFEISFISLLISGVILYKLIEYLNHTNREITRFLLSVKYSDFSQNFSKEYFSKSFNELGDAFQEVINKFQETKKETEEHYKYLQTVTHHVAVGLISFSPSGKVELFNNAAKKILNQNSLKNINELSKNNKELSDLFWNIQPGKKQTYKMMVNSEIVNLFIYATEFRLHDQKYKLVALQNIQTELDENEMEAWQKLIRVLTHEIMNSVTPISSLSSTANNMLTDINCADNSQETMEDLKAAISTIQKRSEGLINFVNKYRDLTRIPKPNFRLIPISNVFERIRVLMQSEISNKDIRCNISLEPEDIKIVADPDLIEQVLINLILNAIYALNGIPEPRIEINVNYDANSKVVIKIKDNGCGIEREVQDKIFIPFFTTKKEGSGIGLSLSRQIMRLHGGTISVNSDPQNGTVFTIKV